MPRIAPSSAGELADALAAGASKNRTINLVGRNSKCLMAGPVGSADVEISTAGLQRVLQYEPNDLTISVEAGMPFRDLQRLLGENRQMVALDPPFAAEATIGGTVAANLSGPLRRGFGTARDLIIGMTFATLEGKLIKTGGMVVKNVAGLDMAKIVIGSFGTLAAMTSINFRVHSLPEQTRTFLFAYAELESVLTKRHAVLGSVLQPMAVDLLSPETATRLERRGYLLAIRAGGSTAVLDRYQRDLTGSELLDGNAEHEFWGQVRDFTPSYLRREPDGVVLRISTTLSEMLPLLRVVTGPSISRAGSGVTYAYFSSWRDAQRIWELAAERNWQSVIEFAPDVVRAAEELWRVGSSSAEQNGFAIMKNIKQMFDPHILLNRSRLYGRL